MGLLSDAAIAARVALPDSDPNRLRISDFAPALRRPSGMPSYGLSCYGYDLKLASEFLILDTDALSQEPNPWIEPGKPGTWRKINAPHFVLRPGGFVLARSEEWVRVPRDCGATVFGKSTWARLGICLNTTLLEPEWEGEITLEISNIGTAPVRLTAGAGVCQVVFGTADDEYLLLSSYADRAGATYQNQRGVTPARVYGANLT